MPASENPARLRAICVDCGPPSIRLLCGCGRCVTRNNQICRSCCMIMNMTPRSETERPRYAADVRCFYCGYCGETYTESRLDSCCATSEYCSTCCARNNHRCCRQLIAFSQNRNSEPLFAFPAMAAAHSPGIKHGLLSREDSLAVLGNTLPAFRYNPKGFTVNASKRFAATEIEVDSYNQATATNKVVRLWKSRVVEDGSVGAFEINTTPACGNALIDQIAAYGEAFIQDDCQVKNNCGLHVHIDCRDFGYQEVQKLVRVYHVIEEAFFAAVHEERYHNRYCGHCGNVLFNKIIKQIKPAADKKATSELKKATIRAIYGENSEERHGLIRSSVRSAFEQYRANHYGPGGEIRYRALNLHSYFLRGTVELRLHHGSVDFLEIYGWMKILIDLFDVIYKIPESKLLDLLVVSEKEALKAVSALGFNTPTGRRDIKHPDVGKGAVVLSRMLSADVYGDYCRRVAYFNGRTKTALPSVLIRQQRLAAANPGSARPETADQIDYDDLGDDLTDEPEDLSDDFPEEAED